MPDSFDSLLDRQPKASWLIEPSDRPLLELSRLRAIQQKAMAELQAHADLLQAIRSEAEEGSFEAERLREGVSFVRRKRLADLEWLQPGIDRLSRHLAERGSDLSPEIRSVYEENLETAQRWLSLYQSLADRLLDLAAERGLDASDRLQPRPVAGQIDYAELSREFMRRFPKIRAALAK